MLFSDKKLVDEILYLTNDNILCYVLSNYEIKKSKYHTIINISGFNLSYVIISIVDNTNMIKVRSNVAINPNFNNSLKSFFKYNYRIYLLNQLNII